MQQVCLGILRFCLAAWVGISLFFVVLVINLRQSDLFAEEIKLNHPRVLFPLYYACEMAILGPALACTFVGLRNSRVGRGRRYALAVLVSVALALAVWDYAMVYRDLLELMNGPLPLPPAFQSLHRLSRRLNEVIVTAVAIATVVALVPEKPQAPAV